MFLLKNEIIGKVSIPNSNVLIGSFKTYESVTYKRKKTACKIKKNKKTLMIVLLNDDFFFKKTRYSPFEIWETTAYKIKKT